MKPNASHWNVTAEIRFVLAVVLLVISFSFCKGDEDYGPGWMTYGDSTLTLSHSPSNPTSGLQAPGVIPTIDADYPTDEIKELARGLQYDPLRIFNFVRNQIRYEHYYGCKKGAGLTLLEKSGNDFDQCALLVSLLRESALTNTVIGSVSYQYGMMAIPENSSNGRDQKTWLGFDNVTVAGNATINRGLPYFNGSDKSYQGDNGALVLARVCVQASINGTQRRLDPSFKTYEKIAGIDIKNICGYNQATFFAQAGGSSNVAKTQVSGMNPTNLGTYLETLASTFSNYLNSSPTTANLSLQQVMGGRQIISFESTDYSSTAWFPYALELDNWEEIPLGKATQIGITAAAGLSWTMPMAELRGRRLAIVFAETSPYRAQIWLDDSLQQEETGSATGAELALSTSVTHPFRDINRNQSDTSFDKRYQRRDIYSNVSFSGRYAVSYAFDPSSDWIQQRQEKLAAYRAANLADDTREVRTEVLNLMGLQWMRQSRMAIQLLLCATDMDVMYFHQVGRVGQDKGFYVDANVQWSDAKQRQGASTVENKVTGLAAYLASSLEHGVVEQFQDTQAVSTVDLIARALAGGGAVNRSVVGNETRLRPAAATQTVGSWVGTGYAAVTPISTGMFISGGLNGGIAVNRGLASSTYLASYQTSAPKAVIYTPPALPRNFGADPVDLATGAFVFDYTEFASGGAEPRGYAFTRHYNSRLRLQNPAKLGYGWTHSYHYTSTKRSDTEAAFGGGTPAQTTALLVACQAALDCYDSSDPKKWACAMLALNWATDLATNNAISFQMGERNLQFLKKPGGGYLAPPGIPVGLVDIAGGKQELTYRDGNTIVFDTSGKGSEIRDLYGKKMTFAYNSDGTLKTLTDSYNHVLSLTYDTGGNLVKAADGKTVDGTARFVNYTQSGGDLVSYEDPENRIASFQYYPGHLMENNRDASNRMIVQNFYDSFQRVKSQRNSGESAKTWNFSYSSSETIEKDPAGGTQSYLYDETKRLVKKVDAAGRKTSFSYDGQDHKTQTITPNGEVTTTQYDQNHNPVMVIDPLLKTTQFVYDSSQQLDYTIDRRGNTWDSAFNVYHQPWKSQSPEGVLTELTYYPVADAHAGQLWKKTVEGTYTTTLEYDADGYLKKITHPDNSTESFVNNSLGDLLSHTNQRNYVTSYEYNKRRQLVFERLPVVNGINYYLETIYDDSGNPWKTYDRYRNLTTQSYSATQKPLITTFSDTTTLTRQYDNRDWLVNTLDTLSNSDRTEYEPDGNVKATYDPLNRKQTEISYNLNGQISLTKTPLPNNTGDWAISGQEYNARGELWKSVDASILTSEYVTDNNGNPQSFKNRLNQQWQFTYNKDNQIEKTTSPITTHVLEKTYDNRGLIHTIKKPSGSLTTYTLDTLGRVALSSDSLGSIAYVYDAKSRIDTVKESALGSPLIDRDYDAHGRLIKYQHGSDYTLEWIYHDTDAVNKNAFSLKYPGDKKVRYDFDNRGRLWKVKDWNNRLTTYTYDAIGRLEWTTRPNLTKRHVVYDNAGQILKIEELNKNGRIISLVAYPEYWGNGQPAKEFQVPSRPMGVKTHSASMLYDQENRVTTWNGQTVTHDADGNLSDGPLPPTKAGSPSPGMGSYQFDARNRLLNCGGIDYTYDAENLRTLVGAASSTTEWIINPQGSPPQPLVRTKNGVVTRYIWGLGLLYEEDANTQTTKTYHYDQRGSTLALSSDDGLTISDRWAYGPYGESLLHTGSSDTPFCFNGYFGVQTDANGLLYMNARYYNIEMRRFISADPLGFSAGTNFYCFADGDPISLCDPFGLCAQGINPVQSAINKASSVFNSMPMPVQRFVRDGMEFGNDIINLSMQGALGPNPSSIFGNTAGIASNAANATVRWGPATGAGPLGEGVAATFRGGSYTQAVTQEATTLYRAYGGKAAEFGSYWSRTAPTGPLQARIDSALLPQWGNTAEKVSTMTIPKGTTIYEGFAAPQGNLMGGGSQNFIPRP